MEKPKIDQSRCEHWYTADGHCGICGKCPRPGAFR